MSQRDESSTEAEVLKIDEARRPKDQTRVAAFVASAVACPGKLSLPGRRGVGDKSIR